MRKLLAIALFAGVALSQNGGSKIEFCGLGSKHECHCLERTEAIHSKIVTSCEATAKNDKERDACLKRDMIAHCDMAETPTEWDEDGFQWNSEKQEFDGKSAMGPMCAMACKKHDCRCQDGPTCHFGHDASEHDHGK